MSDRARSSSRSPGRERSGSASGPSVRPQGYPPLARVVRTADSDWPTQARPQPKRAEQLEKLAQLHGIQVSYLDIAGRRRIASAETLRTILEIRGVAARDAVEVRDSWREEELRRKRRVLPPVIVSWEGKPFRLDVRLPADVDPREIYCKLYREDGRVQAIFLDQVPGVEGNGEAPRVTRTLSIPNLPLGYHELEVEIRERRHQALIIAAPVKTYSPPENGKDWGIFLPLHALQSNRSWGAGNFGDWQRLSQWTAGLGGKVVGSLPLLAGFLSDPIFEPSPYSPASRLFWNEFFLDLEQIPELTSCPAAQAVLHSSKLQEQLAAFRQDQLIDYRAQMAARRSILERLATSFFATNSPRRKSFTKFLEQRPALKDYAEFRAACEGIQLPWQSWDERMRNGKLQTGDFSETARDYHLYVQWVAQEQISKVLADSRGRGTHLYLDLPLGVHPSSYDVWRERHQFALPASVGAPPDLFFTAGQDWGFPPLDPQRIRHSRCRYVLEYLRFQMRHTGLLRIDHIMGLHRLYWIPPGFPPDQGAYVSYPADELLAIISLESHRHQTVVVGENLGTVPPEVNQAMVRHRIRQIYVVQYEQHPDPRRALLPPLQSVASLNTHDMPTFAAHWLGRDIDHRADLGLVRPDQIARQKRQRQQTNAALEEFLGRKRRLDRTRAASPQLALRACLEWLASGPAELLLVNLEDLWDEQTPQNVPGTSAERPNWRRKARLTLEQICNSPDLRRFLEKLNRLRRDNSLGASSAPQGSVDNETG